jgi:REP element-mobilizing transposase RayT
MHQSTKGQFPTRKQIRLVGRDYASPGAYFITILTAKRSHLFSSIHGGKAHLYTIGEIACEEWLATPTVRPNFHVEKDFTVFMPDHMHAVLWILDENGIPIVYSYADSQPIVSHGYAAQSVSSVISHFKAQVTRRVREMLNQPSYKIWHRGYYETIIRDQDHLENVHRYIQNNPYRWQERHR